MRDRTGASYSTLPRVEENNIDRSPSDFFQGAQEILLQEWAEYDADEDGGDVVAGLAGDVADDPEGDGQAHVEQILGMFVRDVRAGSHIPTFARDVRAGSHIPTFVASVTDSLARDFPGAGYFSSGRAVSYLICLRAKFECTWETPWAPKMMFARNSS